MTASLRIEHLRARVDPTAQPVAARLALQTLVAELDDALPRGLPPQTVLLVRSMRLRVPAVALRQRPDGAARSALRDAGRAYLGECVALAARPARGDSTANAEAVLFADEAELLACLARDAFAARLDRWWWRQLLGSAFPDWRRAFAARPQACAAALRLLARQLPPEAEALAREFGWAASMRAGPDRLQGEPQSMRADRDPGARTNAAPSVVAEASGHGPPYALPAVPSDPRHPRNFAAAADNALAAPSSGGLMAPTRRISAATVPRPAAERRAMVEAGGARHADGPASAPAAQATPTPSEPGTGSIPRAAMPLVPEAAHVFEPTPPFAGMPAMPRLRVEAEAASPPQARQQAPAAARATAGPDDPSPQGTPVSAAPAEPRPGLSRPHPRGLEPRAPSAPLRDEADPSAPLRFDIESSSPEPEPWPLPQPLWSRHARLLLLVNCLLEDALYPDFTRPLDPGFPLPIWELLMRLGEPLIGAGWRDDPLRAALARRVPDLPRRALGRLADDWPQGAETQTGGRQRAPVRRLRREPKHGLERWLLNYAQALRGRLVERLGLPVRPAQGGSNRALAAALTSEPACVWWSEGEVVAVFKMNQHPVEWRLAGLDRDPGHLPTAGVKLRFVFE